MTPKDALDIVGSSKRPDDYEQALLDEGPPYCGTPVASGVITRIALPWTGVKGAKLTPSE